MTNRVKIHSIHSIRVHVHVFYVFARTCVYVYVCVCLCVRARVCHGIGSVVCVVVVVDLLTIAKRFIEHPRFLEVFTGSNTRKRAPQAYFHISELIVLLPIVRANIPLFSRFSHCK